MNLATPSSVQKLQKALHDKAKESSKWRFHALYDKVPQGRAGICLCLLQGQWRNGRRGRSEL
jgi:hypothetical protein